MRSFRHHDVCMRTTLTLDDDVARRLKDLARRQRQPFKEVVNNALRRGLSAQDAAEQCEPYQVDTFGSGFRPGVDPLKLNQLLDELDAAAARDRAALEGAVP
jgi:hypothetical protein